MPTTAHLQQPLPPPAATSSAHPRLTNNKKDGKKATVVPPPIVIWDDEMRIEYRREEDAKRAFLGEGGFARVYSYRTHPHSSSSTTTSAQDLTNLTKEAREQVEKERGWRFEGERQAVKVVPHERLNSTKKKTKLYCEIKIQSMMNHPHIVKLNNTFQDQENIYLCLEECSGGSLMALLRKRTCFTEPEARVYMTQLVSAVMYMHSARVMHRDLKLGNVFVMDKGEKGVVCKVGDFGLAALLDKDSDRRKTMCGTPNYIAPEVLVHRNGHSYEVDIWSLGVIMYTMLVGKTPFQEKSVEGIYDNIKGVNYTWPVNCKVSKPARDLIRAILTPDPKLRPTLNEMLHHSWFTSGPIPSHISSSSLHLEPQYPEMSEEQIKQNFVRVKRRAAVGANLPLAVPKADIVATPQEVGKEVEKAVREQEREFTKAVQPDSPISALLRSARKPPVVAPIHVASSSRGEANLLQKFQNIQKQGTRGSPLRNEAARGTSSQSTKLPGGIKEEDEEEQDRPTNGVAKKTNVLLPSSERRANTAGSNHTTRVVANEKADTKLASGKNEGIYNKVTNTLTSAINYRARGDKLELPAEPATKPTFIACWLDYAHKYGMGYALTDGSVGVQFNDDATMVMTPNKRSIDLIEPKDAEGIQCTRKSLSADVEPTSKTIADRKFLLHHFEAYMEGKLRAAEKACDKGTKSNSELTYMMRYWRLKQLMAFRLSSGVLQFNFHDHTKLVLSENGQVVTYVDDGYVSWTWHLLALVRLETASLADSRERRRMESTWKKLVYARDVVAEMHRPSNKTKA